ncbi:Apolipoprotein N-acyltransferase [Rubritalea squalenifaciens DSM 18772]|uniref:Apolipoprotein N-acyltransferase n=2 Tax=Rubritalea squalenifaciens TaxID=407226 RepID=A0A1M6N787_9BACT|nr:Apolipoprotein N-acyltransferase [Rubritalea squalenifaciens DSM 18772]
MQGMNLTLRLILVVASALLASTVFAPLSWWFLAVVAWIPLFVGIHGTSAKVGGRLCLLHGVIYFGITMAWITKVFVGMSWAIVPLAFIMAFFSMFFGAGYAALSTRYQKGWLVALGGACWWLAVEMVRAEIFVLKFPWMTPGVGLGPGWISPVFGVYGISFFIVLGGMLVAQQGKARIAGGVLLLAMLLSTILRPSPYKVGEDGLRVVAVQAEGVYGDNLIQMADPLAGEADIVLYPEYGFTMDVRQTKHLYDSFAEFSRKHDALMVFGTVTKLDQESFYNTALTMDGDQVLGEHYKNHTVHFFNDGIAGTEAKPVETRKGTFGTPICFDCDYEDTVRQMTGKGAEYFIVPSLDAKHWGLQEHEQHAELFRHRAAENGRWMMVASGSGMTQLIDPYGNRVLSLPLMEEGILSGMLEKRKGLTFFTRAGWLFPWIVLVVGSAWMLWLMGSYYGQKKAQKIGS